ncbi:vascular-related unknown protein 4-like [Manihot esculenta]|uniref:Uncharacterized protein n=1 Tax=Manihot esculenta TaxID=3983 RepID=A0ACC8DX48_MANES|nr:vascular-related unknown protein 4-like [Manihot esculenta]OAY55464.2 hypothetical protein MANES_03G127850v8 [Manihot esculenta]
MEETLRKPGSSSIERTCFHGGDDHEDDHSCDEESGWTMYFEDFFAQRNNNKSDINGENSCFSYDIETSSLVSDAATLVMKKKNNYFYNNNNNNGEAADAAVGLSINSRLSFKKRKNKGALVADDALEDTASSPVNSPKIYDLIMMNQLNKNTKQREKMGVISSSPSLQEKEGRKAMTEQREERREDLGLIGRESGITELKKRGLCLVPLSMVVNYFG